MKFKKIAKIIIFAQLFLAVFLLSSKVFAQNEAAEKVANFESTIMVDSSGIVNVTEKITYDFGNNERHGIFRYIPASNNYNIENAPRHMYIDVVSVTDEGGKAYEYTVNTENNIKNIKIGDPNTTISGVHEYTIFYKVRNGIGSFTDFDEIYWNVTGNGWEVPIEKASATVILPGETKPISGRVHCYTGFEGEGFSCNSVVLGDDAKTTFIQSNLQPGQGLTVAVGFSKGAVPNYVYVEHWYNNKINYYYMAFGVLLLGLVLLLRKIFFVYVPEIHKRSKPIITQFEPPSGLTPSEAGYVYNKNGYMQDNRSLAGDILYLATSGYMKIENQALPKTSYAKRIAPKLGIFAILLVGFGLIAQSFDSIVATIYIVIVLSMVGFFGFKLFFKTTQTSFTQTGKVITDAKDHIQYLYSFVTNSKGPKTTDDLTKEAPYHRFMKYFSKAKRETKKYLGDDSPIDLTEKYEFILFYSAKSIFSAFWQFVLFFGGIIISIVLVNVTSLYTGVAGVIVALPIFTLFILFILNKIATTLYNKRLYKTSDQYYTVMGLRQYIKVAEKDRLMFEHNTSDLSKIFSKLLPFAVAFGLGNKWVKVFDGLLMANPDWYHGANSTFSSAVFASSISGLASSMNIASGSGAPTSSGGGGGSGGGSSGGGGGGGGGGSW